MRAHYYDGKSTAVQAVDITLEGDVCVLRGDALELRWPMQQVSLSERLGNTPRRLSFFEGGHCEVTDLAALDALLAHTQVQRGWLDAMQHSLAWAGLASVLFVAVLILSYVYLLPWSAQAIATRLPVGVLQKMGSSTLITLDRVMLQPSQLPTSRQQALARAFAQLTTLTPAQMPYRIEFRSAPKIGANAFALPDGTIVLLDELVALTQNDDEIVAVLAHERAHVEQRHAARMVLQSSAVGVLMTWYMGDVSSLLATVPSVVMQAQYSREMEADADEIAKQTLRANRLSSCLLGTMLEKLEAAHQSPADTARNADDAVMDYLSSHPASAQRIQQMCPERR